MSFDWPWALVALLAIPLVLGVAWIARRRRRRAAVQVTSIALVLSALPQRSRWRQRLPAALLVVGLAVLSVGAARPQAMVEVASSSTTILLALDVSGSMCSTDLDPNRLVVAQDAATAFVDSQAGGGRIGLVAFAGIAGLLVPPTDDTEKLHAAIDSLSTSRGTAIGQAIITAIDAIAEIDPAVAPTGAEVESDGDASTHAAEIIVVLTDGANSQGVEPEVAAELAADRDVRVFTIGFGTIMPAPLVCSVSQLDGGVDSGIGGGGRGGFGGVGQIDEESLAAVADLTGGRYYRAEDASKLQDALAELPRTVVRSTEDVDLAAWFASAGGLLIASATAFSLWWNRVRRPHSPE